MARTIRPSRERHKKTVDRYAIGLLDIVNELADLGLLFAHLASAATQVSE